MVTTSEVVVEKAEAPRGALGRALGTGQPRNSRKTCQYLGEPWHGSQGRGARAHFSQEGSPLGRPKYVHEGALLFRGPPEEVPPVVLEQPKLRPSPVELLEDPVQSPFGAATVSRLHVFAELLGLAAK